MTLRLTRCYLLLTEGRSPESIARQLSLAPALVREVASTLPVPRDAADDETAAHGQPLRGLNQP
jgi:hypothetical protein